MLNLLLGLAFARAGQERVRAEGAFSVPPVVLVLLHAGLVMVLAAYFYLLHKEWTWHYWVAPARVSGLAVLPLALAHGLLVLAGWFLGCACLRSRRAKSFGIVAGVVGVMFVTSVIVLASRLGTSSTFIGYSRGVTYPMFRVPLGYALVVAGATLTLSATTLLFELSRDGRRVRKY